MLDKHDGKCDILVHNEFPIHVAIQTNPGRSVGIILGPEKSGSMVRSLDRPISFRGPMAVKQQN